MANSSHTTDDLAQCLGRMYRHQTIEERICSHVRAKLALLRDAIRDKEQWNTIMFTHTSEGVGKSFHKNLYQESWIKFFVKMRLKNTRIPQGELLRLNPHLLQ